MDSLDNASPAIIKEHGPNEGHVNQRAPKDLQLKGMSLAENLDKFERSSS